MFTKVNSLCILWVLAYHFPMFGQSAREISIRSDSTTFVYSKCAVQYQRETCFLLKANNSQQSFEIKIYPEPEKKITGMKIIPSSDIIVIDSLVNISNTYFKGKIRLNDIAQGSKATLLLRVLNSSIASMEELNILPWFETRILPEKNVIELYAGEEKEIELPAQNASNIQLPPDLIKTIDFDYTITVRENKLNLLIHPNSVGTKDLTLNLKTRSPFPDASGKLSYSLEPFYIHFSVKPGRLNFINADKTDFFLDNIAEDAEEVQLDQKKGLETGKTYRVENQLEPGGKLIAELYVKSPIGDNKMLCSLRSYSYHKSTDGYLYIKLAGEPKFVTNFNMLPKPAIESISVLHAGEDWSPIAMVHPGEAVQVRIEGKGLAKAKFQFSNCTRVRQDSTRVFDDVVFYSFNVPADIDKKVVFVELNRKRTKYELAIRENQRPKDLDFVSISYGTNSIAMNSPQFSKPIMEIRSLKDVNITFDPSLIDSKTILSGKQYLNYEFKIYNSKNDLIEDQKAENIVICPDESSPRGGFYDRKDCFKSMLNVNDYLLHKTYDLEGWSKLEIIVKHSAGKYSEPGFSRRLIIIKQQFTSVDFQASFPAGLLIKSFGTKGVGELSELSFAFLAQMSFYERDAIQKPKPYKLGAGILVLNVFNLTASSSQPDIGAVVIGSILPLKADSKFNFPLYLGFGYMLKSSDWFALLGPGVQFNF
jgi:hypothetical protein